jgi:cell division transport system ATP-binding protein
MATTEADIRARSAGPTRALPPRPVVIEFDRVTKTYPGGDVGVDDVSFSVRRGEFVFLVGSTGSGKSTLMRLLIKELDPTSGTIRVAGRSLVDISRAKTPYYRRNLGVVFQDFKLLPNRTVHDNVAYALQVTGGTRKEVRAKVPDILRLTGLSLKLHSFPDQLSGGEQQRVSIARAFVNHPPLLLADEPTGNLDPETSVGIMQLLYRINRTGTTVVVATHDHAMVDRMRRRVVELSHGKIVRDEVGGQYAPREMTTAEFGALLREPAPEPHRAGGRLFTSEPDAEPVPEAAAEPEAPAPSRRFAPRPARREPEPEDLFDDAFTDDVFSD